MKYKNGNNIDMGKAENDKHKKEVLEKHAR